MIDVLKCGSLLLEAGNKLAMDRHWRDLVLFYEFYNPDTGRGHGARYVSVLSVIAQDSSHCFLAVFYTAFCSAC